jgi:hypothetical protein
MDLGPNNNTKPAPSIHLSPYASTEERTKHLHIIDKLAVEVSRSVAEVEPLYEDILAHMKDSASIQDYLPILVSRRVKEVLSHS